MKKKVWRKEDIGQEIPNPPVKWGRRHNDYQIPRNPWCPRYPRPSFGCTCRQPLWMVIPPEGVWLNCPVHGAYFVAGSPMVWC